MFEIRTSNPILRTPNRRDPDYFDAYENPSLDQIPFYQSLLTRLYQCFYFLSGPKFLVPFIGKCSKFEIDIAIKATFDIYNSIHCSIQCSEESL